MERDTTRTVVIFRMWMSSGSEPLALFPCENTVDGMVSSYVRVGQHGSANYEGCMTRTRRATAAEYAPLKLELEGLGYVLDIRQRRPGPRGC